MYGFGRQEKFMNGSSMEQTSVKQIPVSQEELAGMGSGDVAYIREMSPSDVEKFISDDLELEPGMKLWALVAADGTPIALTDSHDAALANAWEADLTALSLH